jgi:AbrB family looped-hinge helix DNA binding protein
MDKTMETVKISSKFQIVIPRGVRKGMGLQIGEELAVWQLGDAIELVRAKDPKTLRASSKDLKNDFKREKKDRTL